MLHTRQNKWKTQFLNCKELGMAMYPSAAYWTLTKGRRPCPAPGNWNPRKARTLESGKLRQWATVAPHCVLQTQKLESTTGNIKLGSLSLRSQFIKLMAYLRYGPPCGEQDQRAWDRQLCQYTVPRVMDFPPKE